MSVRPTTEVVAIKNYGGMKTMKTMKTMALACAIMFCATNAYSEGTKELDPAATDLTTLLINDAVYGNFAAYDSNDDQRLYFTVKDVNAEVVYLGFGPPRNSSGATTTGDYFFRIRDPQGNVVAAYGEKEIDDDAGQHNITSYAQAIAGPNGVLTGNPSSGGGYDNAYLFDPVALGLTANGDYSIEFTSTAGTINTTKVYLQWWDITVADRNQVDNGLAATAYPGRVWAFNWGLRTPQVDGSSGGYDDAWDRPFNGKVFIFSDNDVDGTLKGFVNEIDFLNSGFRGLSFNIAFNSTGVANTGNVTADRQSVENANQTLVEYPIFLNDPDDTCWLTDEVGEIDLAVTSLLCTTVGMSEICFEVTKPGQVEILLDFDNTTIGEFDENGTDIILATTVTAAPGDPGPYSVCIPWDLRKGDGKLMALGSSVQMYGSLQQGVFHFPVYDVERVPVGYNIAPVRPAGANFTDNFFYDDTLIVSQDGAMSGTGEPKLELNGCPSPCHGWTSFNTSGSALGYGNLNTINTWWIGNSSDESTILFQTCLTPVEWSYFRAIDNGSDVMLEWGTETETNNSHFAVFRSYNGIDFEEIGQVAGAGNSLSPKQYSYLDENVVKPKTYYRLEQVDLDGSISNSDIVVITKDALPPQILLYPSPVTDNNFTIEFEVRDDAKQVTYELFNSAGQVVYSLDFGLYGVGEFARNIQTADMIPGMYVIRLRVGEQSFSEKIIFR